MSGRGLAILKGRRRLHCPSIGGRLNAIWPVQTGPRDPSSSLSLWAPTQSGKQSILGPMSSSCHVDMVGRNGLQAQFSFFFFRPPAGTSSVSHHSMKYIRLLQGVPLIHFPLRLGLDGCIRKAQPSSAKITTSNISPLHSAFLFSYLAKGSTQGHMDM